MTQRLLSVCLCGLMLAGGMVHAQDTLQRAEDSPIATRTLREMQYGVGAYWAYGMHNAAFKTLPPFTNCCNEYGSAVGNTYGVDLLVRDIATSFSIPISARVGYRASSVPFAATTSERMFDGNLETVNAQIEHTVDITWHDLTVGLVADIEIYHPVWLTLGVEGAYTAAARYNQAERLVSPTSMVFETGTDTRNLTSGSLTDFNPFNGAADVGLRIRLLNFGKSDNSIGRWVDLRGRYLWQFTSNYNDPAADNGIGRSYKRHLITLGLETYF